MSAARSHLNLFFFTLVVVVMAGCSVFHGKQTLTMKLGRTVSVAGGKASLYFGGFPYQAAMLELTCSDGSSSMMELYEVQESKEACGVTVKLISVGKSSFGTDMGVFEVAW